ncbi:MAG: hypothetical protein PVJ38_03775 [Candidatus Bathyarchaeota archaeon]|jgi:hypothetical protein
MGFTKSEWITIAGMIVSILLVPITSFVTTYVFQRSLEQEKRVYSLIHQTYLGEGLHEIESYLSTFGTSTVTAIADFGREIRRLRDDPDIIKKLQFKAEEISNRKNVQDLINRNYGEASKAFPRLQRFGMPLYQAVKNTFYQYSRWLEDALDVSLLEPQLQNIDLLLGEKTGFTAAATLLQNMEIYLERRLRQLDDYIWENNYKTYSDFTELTKSDSFDEFILEFEEYNNFIKLWEDNKGTPEAGDISNEFNDWLLEHININPLES